MISVVKDTGSGKRLHAGKAVGQKKIVNPGKVDNLLLVQDSGDTGY